MNNQVMQLADLHRMFGLAMKDIIVRLWPAEPIPSSYFGLVKRLGDALPRVEAAKRSACIEGARMAFAHVKMHWAKMKVTVVAVEGPPGGNTTKKYTSVMIRVCHSRPRFLSCMYIHDDFMTE